MNSVTPVAACVNMYYSSTLVSIGTLLLRIFFSRQSILVIPVFILETPLSQNVILCLAGYTSKTLDDDQCERTNLLKGVSLYSICSSYKN